MELREQFLEHILNAQDEYDLASLCYTELKTYQPNADVVFVNQYIDGLDRDQKLKRYTKRFRQLRSNIFVHMKTMDIAEGGPAIEFDCFCTKLIDILKKFHCPTDADQNICGAICMFYLLEAVSAYIKTNLMELKDFEENGILGCGPLNDLNSNNCLIYLKERHSFLDNAYKDQKTGFRNPLTTTKLGDLFPGIQIVRRCDLFPEPAGIPYIIPVKLEGGSKKTILEQCRIQIAAIPYIGFKTFDFADLDSGPFYVVYSEEDKAENIQRVLALLDHAIDGGANLIVFPEFIMSPSMRDSISDHLAHMAPERRTQLVLVFAGSTYELSVPGHGNNILHIMSGNGREIAAYYKREPFRTNGKRTYHGNEKSGSGNEEAPYFKRCELLSDRGKECPLLDVEYFGRILPAICRDVIDGEYTAGLAKLFLPSLLVTPAWSASVGSFDAPLAELANTIHTASLLCNCCDAVKEKKSFATCEGLLRWLCRIHIPWKRTTRIGTFYLPRKENTIMEADPPLEISRNCCCHNDCHKLGGCVVQIEIDFSGPQPAGRILNVSHPNS